MINGYRRVIFAVLFTVLMIWAGATPFAAVDPANELALAMLEAEQGGYAGQCALRMMLWTEPAEAGPFVLLHPTPLEQTHLTEAEAKAKSALSVKPDLLPALTLLGRLAWIDGRINDALGYYQRALLMTPDSGQAQLGLIDLHLDRREREKAQAALNAIKSVDSEIISGLGLRLATLAAWRGDGAGAITAVAAAEPPQGEGVLPYLWVLAKGYALSGRPGDAAAIFAREVPIWARALWAEQAALAAQAQEDQEAALNNLGRAGAALPAYPLPKWERGLVLLDRSDAAGAVGALAGEQSGLGTLGAGNLFLLGTAKEEAKDLAGAIRAYGDLLKLRPRLGLAYYGLGRALYLNKRYSDALRYLGQGLKVSPKLPCLYLQRAEVYDQLKMKKQAVKDRETAASIGVTPEIRGWRLQVQSVSGTGPNMVALIGLVGGDVPPRGIFISRDGRRWRWYPWHGTPVALPVAATGQTVFAQPDTTDDKGAIMAGVVPPPFLRDDRPPAFVRQATVNRLDDGLYVSWQTDEPTRAEIRIWPRGGLESTGVKVTVAEFSQWHRVSLGDLVPREYQLRVTIIDAAGNTAGSEGIFFRPDQPAYSLAGQLAINGGAPYTNNRRVTLGLALEGAATGATVRIANEEGQFSGWLPLVPVLAWDLSPGDGAKTVSVQFKRGNAFSPIYTASITLDTKSPVIYGLLIPSAGETEAVLTWKTDEPAEARMDLQQGQSWITVFIGTDYLTDHLATLTGLLPGTRYALRVLTTDRAGNLSQSPLDLVTIVAPDRLPPTGRLLINNGAPYTNSVYVALAIEGGDSDSGLREMAFSNDGLLWSMPEAYTGAKSWRLSPGDGAKTIYLRLTDRAGNVSSGIAAQITLDTVPPAIYGVASQLLPDGRATISWRTDELSYGLVQYGQSTSFYPPDQRELSASALDREHTAAFQPVPGLVHYRIAAGDQAGNVSFSQAASLFVPGRDHAGPAGGITIDGGESYTASTRVTLTLWAEDQGGVSAMQLRNVNYSWGPWESFTNRRSWILTPGDGDKEVQVRFRDAAGNESPAYSARIYLDSRPPILRDLVTTQIGPRSVAVRWRTDEPANGTLFYRRASGGTEYRQSEGRESNPIYEHQIALTNLEPGIVYRARLVVTDRAGNKAESPVFDLSVPAADQRPPTGSITINNGAAFTNRTQVTLGLSAADPDGAVVSMSFSTDGRNWSPEEPYQATRLFNLPAGDGPKTVYARFRDRSGRYSEPVSDRITLDTREPRISGVAWTQAAADAVDITWRTDEPTFGVVRYGIGARNYAERTSDDRASFQQDGGYGYEHRVRIGRLVPGRNYYAVIEAVDRADNRSTSGEFEFRLGAADQRPPTGSIRINNGAAFTNRTQVNLGLSATDPDGAVVSMSFSTDGRSWSPEEPYQTARDFNLPGGDGPKTVYVRYRDRAGNYSTPASAGITLDTREPRISGVAWTQASADAVDITWRTDEPTFGVVRYGIGARNYAERTSDDRASFQQDGGYGYEHRVRIGRLVPGRNYYAVIEAVDRADNRSTSGEFEFRLGAADQRPPAGSITINNGAAFTNRTQVNLGLSATDPDGAVVSMSFSSDGRNWSPEEPYQTARDFNLPGGDGPKTVYVRYRDRAGNYSNPASAGITLDTREPRISGVAWTQASADAVDITWRTDEPTFGVVRYGIGARNYAERTSDDRASFQQDGGYGYEHRVRIGRLVPGRNYYAVIEAVDRADNRSTSGEFQFGLRIAEQRPPTGNIKINNGAAFTNKTQVTLALSATDPDGDLATMSFSADGRNWSPEERYQAARSFNLPGGDGPKTVYVRYRDRAGNYSAPASAAITLDTGAPAISQVAVRVAGKRAVEITWRTNEPTWGEVRYGKESKNHPWQAKERGSRESGEFGLEHRVVLQDLPPGLNYYFVITAYDRAGNSTSSPEGHFDLKENNRGQIGNPSIPGAGIGTGRVSGTNAALMDNGGRAGANQSGRGGQGNEAAIDVNDGGRRLASLDRFDAARDEVSYAPILDNGHIANA